MMRIRITRRWSIILGLTLWPLLAAAQDFDPAEAFGALPRFQHATLSPDGVKPAFVMPRDDGEYVGIINLEDTSQEMRGLLIDGNATFISWLADDRLAIGYRVTGFFRRLNFTRL